MTRCRSTGVPGRRRATPAVRRSLRTSRRRCRSWVVSCDACGHQSGAHVAGFAEQDLSDPVAGGVDECVLFFGQVVGGVGADESGDDGSHVGAVVESGCRLCHSATWVGLLGWVVSVLLMDILTL